MTVFREVVPAGSEVVPAEVVLVVPRPKGRGEPGTTRTPRGRNHIEEPHRGTTSGRKTAKQAANSAANVRGKSGDPARGAACTPLWLAQAVGRFDLDPFSNERSHIAADAACWLERGDDGFGDVEPSDRVPGVYTTLGRTHVASASTRTWIQPPYDIVLRAYRHYRHTAWTALLRFDPRPEWFDEIYGDAELVCVPRGTYDAAGNRISTTFNFELAPGLRASGNTFPHALYYRRAEDATPEVLRSCVSWRKKRRCP